jgi:hypothetical protein
MTSFNEDVHPDLRALNALGIHRNLGGCAECRKETDMNFPIGRKLLIQAIEEAADTGRGPVYADEMVTLTYEGGKLSIQPFKLADIGNEDAQYRFLHSVLLEEHRPKPFTDWRHLEVRGKGRYRQGTGMGWQALRGTLERHGVTASEATDVLNRMLDDGLVIRLGEFENACAGGNFMMYGAVLKSEQKETA